MTAGDPAPESAADAFIASQARPEPRQEICWACNGIRYLTERCWVCAGSGHITVEREA